MKMKNRMLLLIICLISCVTLLCSCGGSSKMKDGFYTAQMSAYEFGWKEYVWILVKDNKIVSAEFNAKDPNGYIKAWDNEYMRNMKTIGQQTYPNEYTRKYVEQLVTNQSSDHLDTLSGATTSGDNFKKLAAAVIEQARSGNKEVVEVPAAG